MLCLHPTNADGKAQTAGLVGLPTRHYGHQLAQRGFVCLIPDYPSFGDYKATTSSKRSREREEPLYVSGTMKAIWNNIRAVDLLESLGYVDPDNIGTIGHSLGGHNALFTAVFEPRLKCVVTSCGFTAFHDYYNGDLKGWTSDRYMPRIRDVYENNPDKMPFDFPEVLAAIAPRGIYVAAPLTWTTTSTSAASANASPPPSRCSTSSAARTNSSSSIPTAATTSRTTSASGCISGWKSSSSRLKRDHEITDRKRQAEEVASPFSLSFVNFVVHNYLESPLRGRCPQTSAARGSGAAGRP